MLGQKLVGQVALLVAHGGDDILGLLGHLVEEEVDDTKAPLSKDFSLEVRKKVIQGVRTLQSCRFLFTKGNTFG